MTEPKIHMTDEQLGMSNPDKGEIKLYLYEHELSWGEFIDLDGNVHHYCGPDAMDELRKLL